MIILFIFYANVRCDNSSFLLSQIGLAVGDIDTIRKTAALERYTSQVCIVGMSMCYLRLHRFGKRKERRKERRKSEQTECASDVFW